MQPQNSTLVEPGVYRLDLGMGQGADGKSQYKYVDKTGANLPNYKPAMQTTAQQTRKDITTAQKIDAVSGSSPTPITQNGQNTQQQQQNQQAQATNPDGTPTTAINYKNPDGTTVEITDTPAPNSYAYGSQTRLNDGEKFGYGTDGKRYIVDKGGKVRNDAFADQEYETNKAEINREKEKVALFDSLKTNLDTAHQGIIDSIKSTFAVRRQKMADINKRYLALKQNEGFSGGQARYMSDINSGVLQDEELQGETRLAELDAQEKTLIAQAVQAKSTKDFDLAIKKMNELDELQKEKQDTIQKVYKAAVDYNKMLDDQAKELRLKEKDQFEQGLKALTTSAPALLKGYDSIKSEDKKIEFINTYSKKLKVSPEVLMGALEDQKTQNTKEEADINAKNRSNRPKAGVTVDEFGDETEMTPEDVAKVQKSQDFFAKVDEMIASGFRNSAGVPVATDKGYLTYAAFNDLLTTALSLGISREDFIDRFQGKLNLSTFSKAKSGYKLTDSEYNKLKKSN